MKKTNCRKTFFYAMFFLMWFSLFGFLCKFAFCLNGAIFQYLNINHKDLMIVIAFSVLCITGFVCLTVIVVKDDGGICLKKLEALKELKPAKDDFSAGINTKLEERKEYANGECETKQKSVYYELMKTYMQSITEI